MCPKSVLKKFYVCNVLLFVLVFIGEINFIRYTCTKLLVCLPVLSSVFGLKFNSRLDSDMSAQV